ncbi:1-acyl-sn-glycerol-3-phosphate acyltransferase (plasmid) [Deinococcus taeanensis]|uniref:lysophospholipid acyltransferase family protein n=1 Tax=Deinococcus taeanensis TaxID=2737050 RepID=UPI001CDD2219|nr:lysophospholipid acyltransferase family protein [Deinococcus taeanensis]UBV44548.1 1-acyl-sn-glycerol-3-phosphate acyltransferase [Deinococcus taeanensis]
MRAEASPPPLLQFRPGSAGDWLRFMGGGRALLWQAAHELRSLPVALTPRQRDDAQKRVSARLLRHLRVRLHLHGTARVGAGPYLVIALHESVVDVLALLQLPLPLRFVAREEIFTWPGVGPAITRLGHVSIDPESGSGGYRHLLQRARAITAEGESLVLFPQGTVLGLDTDFQRGAFALAKHLNLPILPVALTGAHRVWEHPFSPVLRYGQPVGLRVLPEVTQEKVRCTSAETLRVHLRRRMKAAALDGRLPAPRRYDPERDGYWHGFHFSIDPDFPQVQALVAAHRRTPPGGTP